MHWYVNVENQAYGPYSDDQMRGFVAEGRITTASLISHTPENGFYGAGEFDEFNLWSGAAREVLQPLVAVGEQMEAQMGGQVGSQSGTSAQYAPIQSVTQTNAQHVQPIYQPTQQPAAQPAPNGMGQESVSSTQPAAQSPKQSDVFLIMAEIRSEGEMGFLQTMQSFGQAERIGDTVWLVRSPHSVEQIRNTLSQTLNQQDRLFILDSSAGKTAWFNIGADLDHRIRELWDEDPS